MAGFMRYLRFITRRERIISTVWIVLIVGFTFLIALMYPSLLGDDVTKTAMLEMLKSPAMVGMLGPVYGADVYTVGISFSQMMTVWVMITFAVMNIFFVNRHTRTDEEQGRLEMLRSLPVGKLTNSVAAITGAFILNFIIAALTSVAILIVNFEGCSVIGAVLYSFEIGTFGFLMAAVTLLCAQLFSTSRGSSGAAYTMLGIFYLMRIAGDYTDGIISYISPMGLGLRVFAFHDNNLYPIVIQLLESVVLIIISLAVCVKRDLGEGVIPAKKGRAYAKKSLLSPFGFALRLTKNAAIVWCAVIFIVAAMYGSIIGDIDSFIESNDFYKQIMMIDDNTANNLTDNFIAMLFLIMAHIAVIPVITIAGKLRSEESHGRLEQIFARSVKRPHMIGAFTVIALIESALVLFCAVLGLYTPSIGAETVVFGDLLKSGMCYLPGMWVFAGISILLTGILPKGGVLVWFVYAYSFGVVYLGGMLKLPEVFQTFSPFGNIPQLPIQEFNIVPLIILTLTAIILIALGIWKFNKRDIA